MASAVHQRLRAATRGDHERLESRVDIVRRAGSPAGRRALVLGFHRLHAEAEAALAPWLSGFVDLEFEARRRTVQLTRDLAALGVEAPRAARAIGVGGAAEALGRMYVLEGSTLGGQVVRRTLAAAGQDMTGLSFLEPYGERAGERWRGFLAVLEAAVADGAQLDDLAGGAVAGFRHAEACLTGDVEHV